MTTDKEVSKGPSIRARRKEKDVNVLLVGSQAADADEIKKALGAITGLSYTTWYCSDPEEAMEFVKIKEFDIDLIFLDLSLFTSDYPKEYFLQMKEGIPDIPIIVLTDRTDYDLINFVMGEGAADNVSQWHVRSDPDRLRNIVESCCARDKIAKLKNEKTAAVLEEAQVQTSQTIEKSAADLLVASDENAQLRKDKDKSVSDLKDAIDTSDALLNKTQKRATAELRLAKDENAQLRIDKDRGEADLKQAQARNVTNLREANDKGDADLKAANDKSGAVLQLSLDDHAAELQSANDDNSQLRRDNDKSNIDLQEARNKGDAELKKAQDESDAALKHAREKGATELKKVEDENTELRKDNDHAREMLSGAYSGGVPEKPVD